MIRQFWIDNHERLSSEEKRWLWEKGFIGFFESIFGPNESTTA